MSPATKARRPLGVRLLIWLGLGILVIVVLLALVLLALREPDTDGVAMRAKYTNAASQFIELSPGTRVHVRDEGPRDGPVVMLLHGSNASLHTWEPWVARLVDRYRVVTLDFPAHGLSGAVPNRDYSTDSYVAIVEAVRLKLKIDRMVLGGNSMGGGVAWRYAVAHPERLAGLVLVDASGKPMPAGSKPPLGFYLARIPMARDILASVTPRWIIERSLIQSVSVTGIVDDAMIDRYWELLLYPENRQATLDRFSQYNPPGDGEALRKLDVPTVILWGREDRLIPVTVADWFAERLPNARVTVLDGVGHIPMEEAPDRSLVPLLRLLSEVYATPASPAPAAAAAGG
ncbi:alpha/beta hydrolase [Polymorphobacter multimanifer]|uniref:Pimeloyl-ACP methyl ester carboxylesterase n=1 Tax=Polymorphobacter multimanifer TaxID=1070431 RepID=A0A841L1K9_9SPHN|nr:alpha/beta hydrolase [Polymorphobacter multimanifer]MBB6226310.1 pimeloyl-ACP methyl ester carboxylesterase [Polymorphobacter multimanifer]GGI81140.1 alpha/beta hydrolase [Polymorphobacter multimanifer]